MEELSADKKASTLFTKDMHHKNITVIFAVQKLFKQGKSKRDIALNCQVIVLFKSPRDVQQILFTPDRYQGLGKSIPGGH